MKAILSPVRTDEARRLRRMGVDKFSGRTLQVTDREPTSNTITSVQKDNYLIEIYEKTIDFHR